MRIVAGTRVVVAHFTVLMIALMVFLPRPSARAAAGAVNRSSKAVDLLVVDQSGNAPIAGARIIARSAMGGGETTTDPEGHLSVRVPSPVGFSLEVHADGYVDKILFWGRDPIPPTYTVALDRGSKIGGRVLDDAGEPIAGAHVILFLEGSTSNGHSSQLPHERLDVHNREVRTDADGTWTFDGAPAQIRSATIGAWDYNHVVEPYYPLQEISPASSLSDGAFHIDDVPPGSYKLYLSLAHNPPGDAGMLGEEFANGSITFVVPDEKSDQPVDIGSVPISVLKAKNIAPEHRIR